MARLDPLWAICSRDDARNGRWDLDTFFASGADEIAAVFSHLEARPARSGAALDFGCGAGRIVRALSTRFELCYGVDSSAEMVRLARELNSDLENCVFEHKSYPLLAEIRSNTIDFVYSSFVLQHLPSEREVLDYVREFARIVRPGGTIVFQLPESLSLRYRVQPRRRLFRALSKLGLSERWLYRRARLHPISMIGVDETQVRSVLAHTGAATRRVEVVDPKSAIAGKRYFAAPAAGHAD
ncbi:MAG TPA: class I SAM-dependent methyltransferase [Thermoleophilaceae bacterium]